MLFLALAVACSVGVAVLFKYADRAKLPTFALFSVNYLIAAVSAVVGSGGFGGVTMTTEILSFGMVLGVLFVWCFFLLMLAVRKLGMVIPVALMRLAVVLPILGSIFLFHEQPSMLQTAGIALAFIALPLASQEKLTMKSLKPLLHGGLGWGLLLFVSFGVTEFLFKVQKEILPIADAYNLLVVEFGTALAITAVTAAVRRERFSRTVVGFGVLLGMLNLFSTYFFMRALDVLPGIVAYPSNGIGIIVVSSLVGVLLWKEVLPPRNIVSLVLAVAALLLIS